MNEDFEDQLRLAIRHDDVEIAADTDAAIRYGRQIVRGRRIGWGVAADGGWPPAAGSSSSAWRQRSSFPALRSGASPACRSSRVPQRAPPPRPAYSPARSGTP